MSPKYTLIHTVLFSLFTRLFCCFELKNPSFSIHLSCIPFSIFFFSWGQTFEKLCPSHSLFHSQADSTLPYVLCVPSLSVLCNRSYFHPCLSATVAAGWLNIYIFHSLVTFPCCRSGSPSLLAALLLTDYRLQISYGHGKWYTRKGEADGRWTKMV